MKFEGMEFGRTEFIPYLCTRMMVP